MAKLGTVTFKGVSSNTYEFTAYTRDTTFKEIGAVYFMTARNPNGEGGYSHTRIYVGQTGNLSNRPLNHHRKDCFDDHGANCVCIYTEESEDDRLVIETDLRENYDPPCNQE
jgi:hypothetical protein